MEFKNLSKIVLNTICKNYPDWQSESVGYTSTKNFIVIKVNKSLEFLQGKPDKQLSKNFVKELIEANPSIFNINNLQKALEIGITELVFSCGFLISLIKRNKLNNVSFINYATLIKTKLTQQTLIYLLIINHYIFSLKSNIEQEYILRKEDDIFKLLDDDYEYIKCYLTKINEANALFYFLDPQNKCPFYLIKIACEKRNLKVNETKRIYKYLARAIEEGVTKSKFVRNISKLDIVLDIKGKYHQRRVNYNNLYLICFNKKGLASFKLLTLNSNKYKIEKQTEYKYKPKEVRKKFKLFKKLCSYVNLVKSTESPVLIM